MHAISKKDLGVFKLLGKLIVFMWITFCLHGKSQSLDGLTYNWEKVATGLTSFRGLSQQRANQAPVVHTQVKKPHLLPDLDP